MWLLRAASLVGLIVDGAMRTSGQAAPAPVFEVASIRPSQPGLQGVNVLCESGRFTIYHATLKALMQMAWRVRDVQVVGGPGWMDSDEYFISAKGAPSATDPQCGAMLQALLTDRFALSIRRETRQLPIYAMVVAPKGAKFHESATNTGVSLTASKGKTTARKISMSNLARILSNEMDHPVLDRTGLTGRYDFDLEWTPEGDPDGGGPSIFTAVQEQLGLRLETQTGPVEVLVIDHAERPSDN